MSVTVAQDPIFVDDQFGVIWADAPIRLCAERVPCGECKHGECVKWPANTPTPHMDLDDWRVRIDAPSGTCTVWVLIL
jgi:hypothetical protein